MRVINDPLGQTHSFVSSDRYSCLNVLFCEILNSGWQRTDGRTDVQTTRAKIVITTGRDCGSASWINKANWLSVYFRYILASFKG